MGKQCVLNQLGDAGGEEYQLVVEDMDNATWAFTDRPARNEEVLFTKAFVETSHREFGSDPPNAAVTFVDVDGGQHGPLVSIFVDATYLAEPAPPPLAHDVIVEEVHVQRRLQHAAEVHHVVVAISRLEVRPIHPVHDVQRAIRAHEEDVIPRQVLHLPIALQDDELGQDGHGLEVDAEHPQQFLDVLEQVQPRPLPADQVGQRRQGEAGQDGEFQVAEGVLALVVRRANGLPGSDGVHDARRARDVQDLHDRVVQAVIRREQVGVPREEDDEEELVGAEGDAGGVLRHAEAEEQDDDGEDVGHVPAQAEDVHGHGCDGRVVIIFAR
ncbi:hypothetical protein ACHAWF_003355 [Thalassiosira exigua]